MKPKNKGKSPLLTYDIQEENIYTYSSDVLNLRDL